MQIITTEKEKKKKINQSVGARTTYNNNVTAQMHRIRNRSRIMDKIAYTPSVNPRYPRGEIRFLESKNIITYITNKIMLNNEHCAKIRAEFVLSRFRCEYRTSIRNSQKSNVERIDKHATLDRFFKIFEVGLSLHIITYSLSLFPAYVFLFFPRHERITRT